MLEELCEFAATVASFTVYLVLGVVVFALTLAACAAFLYGVCIGAAAWLL